MTLAARKHTCPKERQKGRKDVGNGKTERRGGPRVPLCSFVDTLKMHNYGGREGEGVQILTRAMATNSLRLDTFKVIMASGVSDGFATRRWRLCPSRPPALVKNVRGGVSGMTGWFGESRASSLPAS